MSKQRTVNFCGHSDDIFGWHDSNGKADELDNCADGSGMAYLLKCGEERMYVVGWYAPKTPATKSATWVVGVQQFDDSVALPDWPIRIRTADSGYSALLSIDVPPGTTIKPVQSKESP